MENKQEILNNVYEALLAKGRITGKKGFAALLGVRIENGPRRETRAVCYFSAVQSVTGKPLEINGKTPEFL